MSCDVHMKLVYRETGAFAGLTRSAEVPLDALETREAEAVHAAAATPSATSAVREAKLPDLEAVQLYLVGDDGHWQPLLSGTGETDPVLRRLAERLGRQARYERQ